jgi:predicted amidophosphoribosyltransferase
MRTGPLRRAIDRYKVEEKRAWAAIFARVLLGYLDAHRAVFRRYDLIIPSPTWVGEGGRKFDHTGLVIEKAILGVAEVGGPYRCSACGG